MNHMNRSSCVISLTTSITLRSQRRSNRNWLGKNEFQLKKKLSRAFGNSITKAAASIAKDKISMEVRKILLSDAGNDAHLSLRTIFTKKS